MFKFVALLVLVTGALASPISYWNTASATQCATRCSESTKFNYEPGKTYEYRYDSQMTTSIQGATEEQSSLFMTSTIQMEVISKCEMVLRLTDVSLQDAEPNAQEQKQHVERAWEFKRTLQEKPLRFAFVDGQVEAVCPQEGEETWALNIKKGILSTVQNTMVSLEYGINTREVDVSGDCPVEYRIIPEGWGRKIKKVKDVLGCNDRHNHAFSFRASDYETTSRLQSLPIMKSTHECTQEMTSRNILQKSSCVEKHTFRPFSKQDSGARTDIIYSLTYSRESQGIRQTQEQLPIAQRTNLLFTHERADDENKEDLREAMQTLTTICAKTAQDIRPEVPRLFAQLVRTMRAMDRNSMRSLWTSVSSARPCKKAESFFRDAVPMLGSTASVTIIRELIASGKVSDIEAEIWLTSISFIAKPSLEILREIKPLLSMEHPYRKAALSVSSLVHNYCRENVRCETLQEVAEILKIFENNLSYNCKADDMEKHDIILMSLKAIGNIGHADRLTATISRCLINKDIPMEVRIAATQAYRRIGCTADRSELMRIFSDKEQDSELRINAYLSLMHCPDRTILDRVRRVLETEEVNQVGSFVWTHLTNLMEASSPQKEAIRNIISSQDLIRQFDVDKRKFSRNIEWSAFSDMVNMGASVESNIIFSQDSFVPRSASLNLTVDMFGQSVNLLEMGGRVQGVENVLESLFGPRRKSNAVEPKPASYVMKNELDNMANKFKVPSNEPQASYFLRVFGNEIRYGDFHGLDTGTIKDKLNYLDWLIDLAKDHDIDVTKSILFLDTGLSIPTGVGMPLKLNVDGATTVGVKVRGKLDIRKMMSSTPSVDIGGNISPSAAVEICTNMIVDAHVSRTGLKMISTLHTSTVTDGKIQLKDGKIFNMDINVPQEKMEIINVQSKVFIEYRDQAREQSMIREGRIEKKGCYNGAVKALGLQLCGQVSLPHAYKKANAPWYPFTGPSNAMVTLNKKDTMTGYHFEYKLLREKNRVDSGVEITDVAKMSFNTPGSSINREFTLDFNLNQAQKSLSLQLKTPWKNFESKGSIVNLDELKRVSGNLLIGQKEYSALAEVQIDKSGGKEQYVPKFQLNLPAKRPYTLLGSVVYKPSKNKADIDLALRNVFSEPITLKGGGTIQDTRKKSKYSLALEFGSPKMEGKFSGFVAKDLGTGKSYSSRIDVGYSLDNRRPESLKFSGKIRDTSADGNYGYAVSSLTESSMWAQYNTNMDLEFTKTPKSISSKIDAGFDRNRKIKLVQSCSYNFDGKDAQLNGLFTFELPFKNLAYELKAENMLVKKDQNLRSFISARLSPSHEYVSEIKIVRESQKPLKHRVEGRVEYPGRQMRLVQTVDETRPREYTHSFNMHLDQFQRIVANSVYKMGPRHDLTSTITVLEYEPIILKGSLKPDLYNMEGNAQVTVGENNVYSVKGMWSHNGVLRAFSTRGDFELYYPDRRIKVNGQAMRRNTDLNGNFVTQWDADRDQTKKFGLNGKATLSTDAPQAQMKVQWYPNNFVNVDASGKYQKQGWYTTNEDLEGSVRITTSYRDVRDVSSKFKYDHGHNFVKTSGEVEMSPGKKIIGNFDFKKLKGWKNIESLLTVTTPFEQLQNIKANVNYNLNRNSLTSNAKAEWDAKQMELSVNGGADPTTLTGEVKFTSPIRALQAISLGFRHNAQNGDYRTNMEASWSPRDKITAGLNMHHERAGWNVKNNGRVSLSTPFRQMRQSTVSWTHDNDDDSVKSHAEMEWNRQKTELDVSALHKKSYRKRKIETTISFTSPYPNMESLNLNVKHEHERRSWNGISSDAAVQWAPGRVIRYNHEAGVTPQQVMFKTKLFTPFRGMESTSLDLVSQLRENAVSTMNELKWGSNQKISLTGNLNKQNTEITGQMRLTTPFTPMERTIFNVRGTSSGPNTWDNAEGHWNLEYGRGKRISMDHKYSLGNLKMISLDFKSPCPYLQLVSLSGEISGNPREFSGKAEFNHNMLGDKMAMDVLFRTSNLRNMKAVFNARSPLRAVRYIKASATHTRTSPTNWVTEGSINIPGYKGTTSHDFTFTDWKNFRTNSELEYIRGKTIELTTDMQTGEAMIGKFDFKNPFTKDVSISFNHRGRLNNFKFSGEVSNPRDKITASVDFRKQRSSVHGNARFTSPFTQARRVVLAVNHDGPLTAFRNDASFEWNNRRVSGESEFTLSETDMRTTAKLTTPANGIFRTMELNVNHNGGWREFSNQGHLRLGDKDIRGNSEFKYDNTVSGRMELTTPTQLLRSVKAEFNHNARKWNNFENSGKIEYNGNTYTGESEFRWFSSLFKSSAKVLIPDEYSIYVKHQGSSTNFNNNGKIQMGQSIISGNSNFKIDGNKIEAKATVNTPYTNFRETSATLNHEGTLNQFKTNANIKTSVTGYDRFTGEISHSGNLRNFRCNVKVDTPFRRVPSITGVVSHNQDDDSITSTASVQYNGKEVTSGFNFRRINKGFGASVKIQTPYPKLELFEASINHKGKWKKFNTAASIKTAYPGYNRFSGEVKHNGNLRDFRSSAVVETPFSGYTRFLGDISHSHSPDWTSISTTGQIETPLSRYRHLSFNMDHNGDRNQFTTNGKFETTTPGFEKFAASVSHNGDPSNIKSSVSVETPFRGYDKFSASVEHTKSPRGFRTKTDIRTPFAGYEKFNLNLNHDGNMRNFQTSARMRTPFSQLRYVTANVNHRGNLNDFTSGGSLEYNGKKLEGEASFKGTPEWRDTKYEGSLKLNTPFEPIQSLQVVASHDMRPEIKKGKLEVSHNGIKRVDLDYDFSWGDVKTFHILYRQPRPMEYSVTIAKPENSLIITTAYNWNMQRRDSFFNTELNLKNIKTYYTTERGMTVKMTLPTRMVVLTTGYNLGSGRLTHKTDFQWNYAADKKMSYQLEASKTERRSRNIYDGSFKLTSPLLNFDSDFNHKSISGQQYTTAITLSSGQRVQIKNELTLGNPTFKNVLTVQHPRFSRAAVVSVEGTLEPKVTDGKVNVQYEDQSFEFNGRVADESSGRDKKYTALCHVNHPNSMLDFQFNGQVNSNDTITGGAMEMKYMMTRDRSYRTFKSRGEVNKANKEVMLEVVTPIKEMRISARNLVSDPMRGVHQFAMVASADNKEIRGELNLDKESKSFETKLFVGDDMFHLYAKYLSSTMTQFELYRKKDGRNIQEILLSMNLRDSQLLSGRAYVRPGIMADVKEFVRGLDMFSGLYDIREQFTSSLNSDLRYKTHYMSQALEPIKTAASVVAIGINEEWNEVKNAYDEMYNRNDFYIQTISQGIHRLKEQISDKMQEEWGILKNRIREVTVGSCEMVRRKMNDLREIYNVNLQRMRVNLDEWTEILYASYNDIQTKVDSFYQILVYQAKQYMDNYKPYMDRYMSSARERFVDLVDRLRNHPRVKALVQKVTTLQPGDYFRPIIAFKDQTINKYNNWYSGAKETIDKISNHPQTKDAVKYLKQLAKNSKYYYRYYKIEENAVNTVNELYKNGWEAAKTKFWSSVDKYLQFDKSRWVAWEPEKGNFEFELWLPLPLRSLQSLPTINIKSYITRAKTWVKQYLPEDFHWKVFDTYYKYKPGSDYTNWIPPFKAHATLAGMQHYMTFDRRFYEYAGECSYLLAKDFIDGNFSVIVNYQRSRRGPVKKSITVVSNNRQIEIQTNGAVTVNGRAVEMPIEFDNTTIARDGHVLNIHNSKGITVTCDFPHDMCTMNVSGWYFGKTAGLMGTYNNEPSDDFTKIDNTRATNAQELADSWTIGQKCRPENYAQIEVPSPDSRRYRLCAKYFQDQNAEYRTCFAVVKPEPFMKMCINDMSSGVNRIESDEDTCNVAAFYVDECRRQGVPMRVSKSCGQPYSGNFLCSYRGLDVESYETFNSLPEGRTFQEGENITLSPSDIPNAADIVFVIQHNDCNKDTISELRKMVSSMAKAFSRVGIQDQQFALVGFGGKSVYAEPHIHTMSGQVFNTGNKLKLPLQSFSLEAGAKADPLAAIRYAAKLPFRTGVAKTIIIFPCSKCTEATVSYGEMQQMLIQRDIALHMLLDVTFKLREVKKKKPTAFIFGLDEDVVYTHKDAGKDPMGDRGLRQHIQVPKDLCVALSLENDGSLLTKQHWFSGKPKNAKKFLDVAARVFVNEAQPSKCQICNCVADDIGVGMPVCTSCEDPAPKKGRTTKKVNRKSKKNRRKVAVQST